MLLVGAIGLDEMPIGLSNRYAIAIGLSNSEYESSIGPSNRSDLDDDGEGEGELRLPVVLHHLSDDQSAPSRQSAQTPATRRAYHQSECRYQQQVEHTIESSRAESLVIRDRALVEFTHGLTRVMRSR